MNLKISKTIGTIVIFILCFLFHYLYKWWPNNISKILFPINESIWEHMKLLFTPFVLYFIIEYYFINKKQNNFFLQLFLVPIIGIISYLIIYLPIYNIIGENILISIFLLLLIIILQQFISYRLSIINEFKYQKFIGVIGLFIIVFIFIFLSFNPLNFYIFTPN